MTTQADPSYPLLRKRHSIDIFVCTVVISLLLHLAASTVLLLPGRYTVPSAAPLFVDLKSMTSPTAADESPAAEPPKAEELLITEAQSLPETASETAPEAARLDKAIESSLQKAVQTPEAVHENAIGLGMVSGHFASFAQGETLKDDIRVYYFSLMRRINEVWWTGDATKGAFVSPASVLVTISRDGKVVGCELLESSGSREQDQALLDSVKKAEPLPPLPPNYQQRTFNAPIRFVPPLRLMLPGFTRKPVLPH